MTSSTRVARRSARAVKVLPRKRRTAVGTARAGPRAARRDARVQALLHDQDVRKRPREGAINARVVYLRATRRGDAAEALLDDRKTRRALRRMIASFREVFAALCGVKRRQRRNAAVRIVVPVVVAGGAGTLAANERIRPKVLAAARESAGTGDNSSRAAGDRGETPATAGVAGDERRAS